MKRLIHLIKIILNILVFYVTEKIVKANLVLENIKFIKLKSEIDYYTIISKIDNDKVKFKLDEVITSKMIDDYLILYAQSET